MYAKKHDQFYTTLPLQEIPVNDLMARKDLFSAVPEDWHVVITDIKNSTQAVQDGIHQIVNLVATGSIIAALNIAREAGIDLPFFFGGDGGTLIVPDAVLQPLIPALAEHRANTLRNFGLELRIGHVPVEKIYEKQRKLHVAKVRINEALTIPVVLGTGLQYAEEVIKGGIYIQNLPEITKPSLNLDGMECRWNRIQPPDHSEEVVSLLVVVRTVEQQAAVFKEVLDAIESIYGPQPRREPISVSKLRLRATFGKIKTEMQTRLGRFDLWYLIRNWILTWIGKGYFQVTKNGKHYLRRLVQLSDTLVLDGRINTVISGTSAQRVRLQASLEKMENAGDLYFGLYASKASIMSCYVRDRLDQHIHFVDGADGGYTKAARILKGKLKG